MRLLLLFPLARQAGKQGRQDREQLPLSLSLPLSRQLTRRTDNKNFRAKHWFFLNGFFGVFPAGYRPVTTTIVFRKLHSIKGPPKPKSLQI